MNIIIVGAGDVGSFLAATLRDQGHNIHIIEASETTAASLDEALDVKIIHGNGASAQMLVKANVSACDFLLSMSDNDKTNLIACSLGKKLGAKKTICRVHDETYNDNSLVNYPMHFGIDFLINPERLCAVELAKHIRNSGRVAIENFARGQIEVHQIKISEKSIYTHRPLKSISFDKNVRIGYVQHADTIEVASGDTILQVGDEITLVGTPEALFALKKKLDPKSTEGEVRVALFGATEVAIALIRLLNNPLYKVRVFHEDLSTCQQLAERFPYITVIHGNAGSLRVLEEEQIGASDYFVACTKEDEVNVMTSLQVSKLGVKHIDLIVNKPDYEEVIRDLIPSLGVEQVVSPRVATYNDFIRCMAPDGYAELATLPYGTGKIIEIAVSLDSQCAGVKIKDIQWPPGTFIIAIMHKFQAIVPSGEDTLLGGDRLVAIAHQDHQGQLLELLR